ncbi:MAG: GH3 auxin-responsive promoter family protein [Legionella sp.]|nr:GH3 auxin-responsive promoter family protein [Legionella sp.]
MSWKRRLLATFTWKKYRDFISDTRNPEKAKARLWEKETLPLIKSSKFWQQLMDFYPTPAIDAFNITTYDDYKEALDEGLTTGVLSLNGEKITFWSETSGTSGARKHFPITNAFQRQFQRTMAPFMQSLIKRFPSFLQHKIVYLAACNPQEISPSGIGMGFISNFNYRNLPPLIKSFYALPDEVFVDAETFEKWAPLYALASNLSGIFAVTPMVIESFYELCAKNFAFYRPYLSGHKSLPDNLPPIKISKKRQQYLQNLNENERHSYTALWPGLSVVCCWISGPCEYVAGQLAKVLGEDVALVDGAYSATEGWMTVPLEARQVGGILHPGAHIVEFIEEGEAIVKENLLDSWQLKPDTNYEVFLTTAMGFVRYRLNDIVKCTGFYNKAPRLEFCYKATLLKLEYGAISEQELKEMIKQANFRMDPSWYFVRNSTGDRVVLITDDDVQISEDMLRKLHECLINISENYSYNVASASILPMALLQLPKERLLKNTHAQTKPKLIGQYHNWR